MLLYMDRPLTLHSFPRAILHIDGDAFFASCEQAANPKFQGQPVVTGLERGIASSMSYEAKARGVTRGMPVHEIRRVCPECVILPSDYETYGLMSLRMYEIVRRFTSVVEEYSIDECFADLTGLRRYLRLGYAALSAEIKRTLDAELGVTFSVGLAPSKVLAKVASKWQKPSGLTVIPGRSAHRFLAPLSIDKVWGIGPQTAAFLIQHGMPTALAFARSDQSWVEAHLTKPHREIWHELRGTPVNLVNSEKKTSYKSISKTRTFTPPTKDRELVFSQLSRNIELACGKARMYHLSTRHIFAFIKTKDFRFHGFEVTLDKPTSLPEPIVHALRPEFESMCIPRALYRGTGVFLTELEPIQPDLFGEHVKLERLERVHQSLDELTMKYGKHTVYLGSSFLAMQHLMNAGERGIPAMRQHQGLPIERKRRIFNLPFLGDVH